MPIFKTTPPAASFDCCGGELSPPARQRAALASSGSQRLGTIATAIAVALLPKCPACWSVYAGLSSLLGLSFVVESRYLLPLTAALLALALCALWLQARRGRGYGPWWLANAAAGATLVGKFALESDGLMYTGLGGLLLASLWSSCRWRWLASAGVVAPPARSAPVSAQN